MIKQVNLSQIRPALAENIQSIHRKSKASQQIEHLCPLYAGGYPMSLLFAPRKKGNLNKIDSIYYSDFDVYFSNEDQAKQAISILTSIAIEAPYTTENATTLKVKHPEAIGSPSETFQIVHKISGNPRSILPTFDFVNCAIGYSPSSEKFFIHKDAPQAHTERILDILNPWMITNALQSESEITDNIIIQLLRFKKYCYRWDYTLSEKSFDLLIKAYEAYPNIVVGSNQVIRATGGSYSGQEYYAWRNQNVWKAVAGLMTSHQKWRDYNDEIGHIKAVIPRPEETLNQQIQISQLPF